MPTRLRPSLDAVELDAPRAFTRWLRDYRRPLGEILEHGTWLDREDVDALLNLTIPGIDELIGLLEVARLAGDRPEGRTHRPRWSPGCDKSKGSPASTQHR